MYCLNIEKKSFSKSFNGAKIVNVALNPK